jgi:hypothetical protein
MLNDRTEMAQPAHSLDDDRETIPLVEANSPTTVSESEIY